MYFDFSQQKVAKFSFFMAGLVFFLFATVYAGKFVPSEYSSFAEIVRSIDLATQSFRYTYKFAPFKKDQIFAAVLSSFRNSTPELVLGHTASSTTAGIPVLVYHGIVKNPDRFSMTAGTFSDQMLALKRAGYDTVTLADFELYMQGFKALPPKSILITFDDGRRDSFEGADPILKAAGFNAVMFTTSSQSLKRDVGWKSYYLDYSGVQRLLTSGRWEIGSHAIQDNTNESQIFINKEGRMANFLSNKMWRWDEGRLETDSEFRARVEYELLGSKKILEENFGVPIRSFAYPFGDSGNQSVNYPSATTTVEDIIDNTYTLAFEQVSLENNNPTKFIGNTPDVDHFHVRRIEVGSLWSGEYLVEVLDGGMEKMLPYEDTFTKNNGWRGTWGNPLISTNSLNMSASTSTSGAFAFLDGAREWRDYAYMINTEWEKGTHVSLVSRFTDTKNYVSCVFSEERVRIEEKVNGTVKVLAQIENPLVLPFPNVVLGMHVEGRMVRCLEGSRAVVVAYNLSTDLYRGTVGIQVWDQFRDNAALRVRSLSAVPLEDVDLLVQSAPQYDIR